MLTFTYVGMERPRRQANRVRKEERDMLKTPTFEDTQRYTALDPPHVRERVAVPVVKPDLKAVFRRSARLSDTWRKVVASLVIIGFVGLGVAGALPESESSQAAERLLGSGIRVTGVQQNWGVFSPNPLQLEVRTQAVIQLEDGSAREWRPITDGLFDSSRSCLLYTSPSPRDS